MSEQDQAFGRMEGKLDAMIKLVEDHQAEDAKRFDHHAGRLRTIEDAQAEQRGVLKLAGWVGASGMVTAVVALVKVMFSGNGKHP